MGRVDNSDGFRRKRNFYEVRSWDDGLCANMDLLLGQTAEVRGFLEDQM